MLVRDSISFRGDLSLMKPEARSIWPLGLGLKNVSLIMHLSPGRWFEQPSGLAKDTFQRSKLSYTLGSWDYVTKNWIVVCVCVSGDSRIRWQAKPGWALRLRVRCWSEGGNKSSWSWLRRMCWWCMLCSSNQIGTKHTESPESRRGDWEQWRMRHKLCYWYVLWLTQRTHWYKTNDVICQENHSVYDVKDREICC